MPIFLEDFPDDAIFLARSDAHHLLGTYNCYGFELEGKFWPTAEHYYQGMKFLNDEKQECIRTAKSPDKARKIGRKRDKSFRKDWKTIRQTIMTRAIYTRCKTFSLLAEALTETGQRKLVESSNYDYFWGCGRDRRGNNTYGKVLMNVRNKLSQEINSQNNNP